MVASEAVVTGKVLTPDQLKCMVWDIERGVSNRIEPLAFQTDTCIGNWHYDRGLFQRHGYKRAHTVVAMLLDIVSKNGNLMLNIPLPGNGAPDTDELAIIADITAWMAVNSALIYGSRPWKVYGEGPVVDAASTPDPRAGLQRRQGQTSGSTEDVRFMTQGGNTECVHLWMA